MMQPMTAKELEYIADSMSNEDLLVKQCAVAAQTSQHPMIRNACMDMMNIHQQHYQQLMQCLHQHVPAAPQMPGASS
ncbi:hypothetical protein [Paenibacillus sp. y28]|uniref:hypothetical protein n=1 Tax=Paenibacillus sp. y28 TaxID=3129110 RepID=UPI00301AA446